MGDLLGETTLDWALNTIHLATTATLRQSPPPRWAGARYPHHPPGWWGSRAPLGAPPFLMLHCPTGGGKNRPPGG